MSNIVEAEYTIVQERTLPVIISEIHIIEQNVTKTALEGAVQIGARLQEAKEQIGHGNFEDWCQENLNYSKRTAERFMKLATEFGGENSLLSNTTALSHFSITKALSLLKVPEEERETFVEEHKIEDMTTRELEEEIKRLKEEKEEAEEEAESLRTGREDAEAEVSKMSREVEELKRQLHDAEAAESKLKAKTEIADKLAEELEKKQKKLDKTEAKLKRERESRESELAAEIEKRQADMKREIETKAGKVLQKAEEERKDLKEENEALKRKLSNAGNEGVVKFKILADQLQDIFDQAGQCIRVEPDQDRAEKMKSALRQVLDKFREEL